MSYFLAFRVVFVQGLGAVFVCGFRLSVVTPKQRELQ